MKTVSSVDYIMEDPREATRLESKVESSAWVRKYLANHLRAGAEVLSVGCGPASILRAACAWHPSVRGTGIDISAARIEEAVQRGCGNPQLKFVCGNAHAMPFESNRFDLIYCRMLLQYLQEKERAVAEMARVCRPGGSVLLQDLDGQLLWHYPEDPVVQPAVEKVVAALGATGFDPFVGRKLFSYAKKAGLKNITVQTESYHLIAGEIDPSSMEQWKLKLEIAKPQMVRVLGGKTQAQELTERFLEYLGQPDTLTYSVVFTVIGEKPL
jgi:ubiquinone/menaquinone biosynthesis C-methylase UbiE